MATTSQPRSHRQSRPRPPRGFVCSRGLRFPSPAGGSLGRSDAACRRSGRPRPGSSVPSRRATPRAQPGAATVPPGIPETARRKGRRRRSRRRRSRAARRAAAGGARPRPGRRTLTMPAPQVRGGSRCERVDEASWLADIGGANCFLRKMSPPADTFQIICNKMNLFRNTIVFTN